jgi:serine/threonine protein kinase
MKVRKPVSSWAQSIILDSLVFPHFIIPQSSSWKICLFTIPVIFYTPRKGSRAIGLVDIIRFALAIHSRTAATKYTISWVGEAFPLFGLQTTESALLNQTVFCMSSLTYKRNNQWVSLKILTAESSRESRELRNLTSKYIVQLFDAFTHQGPNGLHQCLVFELLGPSVDKVLTDYYDSGDTLETEDILRMTEQLLEAIQSILDAGMGHGGEPHPYIYSSTWLILVFTG